MLPNTDRYFIKPDKTISKNMRTATNLLLIFMKSMKKNLRYLKDKTIFMKNDLEDF